MARGCVLQALPSGEGSSLKQGWCRARRPVPASSGHLRRAPGSGAPGEGPRPVLQWHADSPTSPCTQSRLSRVSQGSSGYRTLSRQWVLEGD